MLWSRNIVKLLILWEDINLLLSHDLKIRAVIGTHTEWYSECYHVSTFAALIDKD